MVIGDRTPGRSRGSDGDITLLNHPGQCIPALALENTLPVIACDQTGNIYSGRSLVCDAMGVTRSSMGVEQGLIYSDIDYEHTRTTREALPCLGHRRADLYIHLKK